MEVKKYNIIDSSDFPVNSNEVYTNSVLVARLDVGEIINSISTFRDLYFRGILKNRILQEALNDCNGVVLPNFSQEFEDAVNQHLINCTKEQLNAILNKNIEEFSRDRAFHTDPISASIIVNTTDQIRPKLTALTNNSNLEGEHVVNLSYDDLNLVALLRLKGGESFAINTQKLHGVVDDPKNPREKNNSNSVLIF